DLRHTFRTQGAEAGVPLEVMMAQLGHMDRETSLAYVHIQNRALDRAKQLIEAEQAAILAAAQGKSTDERQMAHPPIILNGEVLRSRPASAGAKLMDSVQRSLRGTEKK